MKKFLLVSDGKNFSKHTLDYIKSLHEKEPFLLTGAFFHSIDHDFLIPNTFAPGAAPYLAFTKKEHDCYLKGIEEFKTLCVRYNIEHRVHQESEEWKINDLVKESRFTDLVIISGEQFFPDSEKKQPNEFMQDVLHRSECPVLVVPEDAKPIKRIVDAYNACW